MLRTGFEKAEGNVYRFPIEYLPSRFILDTYLNFTLDEMVFEGGDTRYIDQIIKFGGDTVGSIKIEWTSWWFEIDRSSIFSLFGCLNKIKLKVPKDIRKLLFQCLRKLEHDYFGDLNKHKSSAAEDLNKHKYSAAEAA